MRQAFGDWRVWCYGLVFFGEGMGTYGLSFALPTIIRQLGYTAANAQLLTIPVYFAAALAVSGFVYTKHQHCVLKRPRRAPCVFRRSS